MAQSPRLTQAIVNSIFHISELPLTKRNYLDNTRPHNRWNDMRGSGQCFLPFLLVRYLGVNSRSFPNSVRGQGKALGSFTHWFFAALITFLFPIIAESGSTGSGNSFAFFSTMMIVQALVAWKYFPETKGKSLEKLGKELSN